VVGALVGGGLLGSVSGLYWLVRREVGMGMGDVKLLALFGAFFGAAASVSILFIAACLGSVVGLGAIALRGGSLKLALPFGPFLALGGGVWLFAGPALEPHVALRLGNLVEIVRWMASGGA
jgi:leader peptidase (prepilin peptidase)/N-methyltransferase